MRKIIGYQINIATLQRINIYSIQREMVQSTTLEVLVIIREH